MVRMSGKTQSTCYVEFGTYSDAQRMVQRRNNRALGTRNVQLSKEQKRIHDGTFVSYFCLLFLPSGTTDLNLVRNLNDNYPTPPDISQLFNSTDMSRQATTVPSSRPSNDRKYAARTSRAHSIQTHRPRVVRRDILEYDESGGVRDSSFFDECKQHPCVEPLKWFCCIFCCSWVCTPCLICSLANYLWYWRKQIR